jgi:hypothetical protein
MTKILLDAQKDSLMYPRKKVGTYFTWNYAVPPRALMNSFHFWNRRAKILCDNLTCVFCYIIVFLCLICLLCRYPESVPLLLVWMVAGVSCAFVDCVRLDRWTNEYKSSIKRAIVHLLER